MKVKTNISIKLFLEEDEDIDTIIESLKPDNVGIEETTSITMKKVADGLEIYIGGKGRLGSFIQTLDDLLRCLSTVFKFTENGNKI